MIRVLRSEDRDRVIEIVRATGNFSDAEAAIARELIDITVEQPTQNDYYAFVAELPDDPKQGPEAGHEGAEARDTLTDRRIAGFLIVGPTPATEGTYDMYWIAVDPAYHGRGIAQELDRYAVEFVRSRNGYWLIAETSSQSSYERTRAFYEKQGYRMLARIPDYYKPNDDLVIYGKRLDA